MTQQKKSLPRRSSWSQGFSPLWGARAPKKPPTAAREATISMTIQTMTTKSRPPRDQRGFPAIWKSDASPAGTMHTNRRNSRSSA